MSTLPHKDFCVGLINTEYFEQSTKTECFPAGQMVPDFVIKDAQICIPWDRMARWNYTSLFKVFNIKYIWSQRKASWVPEHVRESVLWEHIRSARKQEWLNLQLTLGHYNTERRMAGWQQKQSRNWTSAKLHVWVTEATIFNLPQNPLGKEKFPTVPFTAHQSGRRGVGAWLSGVSATLNMERIWSSCLGQESLTCHHMCVCVCVSQPSSFLYINNYRLWSNIITH